MTWQNKSSVFLSLSSLLSRFSDRSISFNNSIALKYNHGPYPIGVYYFKVNNENTRIMNKICSKSTIKTPERRQRCYSGVFIVNFEESSLLVFSVDFEKVNGCWITPDQFPHYSWLRLVSYFFISSLFFPSKSIGCTQRKEIRVNLIE